MGSKKNTGVAHLLMHMEELPGTFEVIESVEHDRKALKLME
jgi:hypothetical protein